MKDMPMVNTNCLEGIKCPDCGNEDAFYIDTSAVMYVTDDGAENRGDTSWNDESHTECAQCERSGKLADFRAKPFPTPTSGHSEINTKGRIEDDHKVLYDLVGLF